MTHRRFADGVLDLSQPPRATESRPSAPQKPICPACGGKLTDISDFSDRRAKRHVYRCTGCRQDQVVPDAR